MSVNHMKKIRPVYGTIKKKESKMSYEPNENEELSLMGCPDWGPKGNRRCYDCCEPVDDITFQCSSSYDDPLASILGKCHVCGAPRYQVLGHCPACGGPVYELSGHFACYRTIDGSCDFQIAIEHMEEHDLTGGYMDMIGLLDGGLQIYESIRGQDKYIVTHARIVHSENGDWDIEELVRLIPKSIG